MTLPVALEDLEGTVGAYGGAAYVLVSIAGGPPRVTHSLARLDGSRLVVSVGQRSAAALAENPAVSVLWAANAAQTTSLIVDGVVTSAIDPEGGEIEIEPTGAVRHRPAWV